MSSTHTASPTGRKGGFPGRPAVVLPIRGTCREVGMTKNLVFAAQIRHPSWQRKRLEVMEDAGWECENCGESGVTLNVHHKQYIKGRMYWEYERHELECLCEDCHKSHHQEQDGLRKLLAEVDVGEAFALVSGFHHASDWIDRGNASQGRECDFPTYAAGLVAWLALGLSIEDIYRVADFAASLAGPQAETRMIEAVEPARNSMMGVWHA